MRLIDADDLIERINVVIEHGLADHDGLHPVSAEVVLETINVIPSAQPEPKKGAWINEGRIIRCNRCKIGYATVKGMKSALTYKFCPNCGVDMRTARQIVHDAIDNTPMAEDVYPGIKERLHKAVDDMREVTT